MRLAALAMLACVTVPIAAVTSTPPFHVVGADELRFPTRGRFIQNAAANERLAFDAASIKRTPDNTGPGADFAVLPGGRLHARNNDVSNLITNAYDVPYYAVIGGPDWLREEKYDIEAIADRERPRAEMLHMLRTLLADRFQLRTHRETRQLPAYIVTVARGGPKLTPCKDGDCIDATCGNNWLSSRGSAPNMKWSAVRIDMAGVTGSLAIYFHRPVVDRTGLTGFFDVDIELPPLQLAATGGPASDSGASVFTVLQEQLGLRVEEGRGPVDVLVVDSIKRPSGN